jgi:hypothetical protein
MSMDDGGQQMNAQMIGEIPKLLEVMDNRNGDNVCCESEAIAEFKAVHLSPASNSSCDRKGIPCRQYLICSKRKIRMVSIR